MYTFLFACIPLILLLVCFSNGKHSWKSFVPPVAFGFLVAFIFCIGKKFVIFNDYIWTADVAAGAIHIAVYEILIPLVACVAAFCIFDRSTLSYKAASVAPLMLTFFAILVPFNVLNGNDYFSKFMIFGKPLLYAGFAIFLSVFATIGADLLEKKLIVPGILFMVVGLAFIAVPAIVEALWYYSGNSVYVIVAAVFALASVVIYLGFNIFKGINKR